MKREVKLEGECTVYFVFGDLNHVDVWPIHNKSRFLKKWLILGLGQEKHKKHLVPETMGRKQELPWRVVHWPNLRWFKHQKHIMDCNTLTITVHGISIHGFIQRRKGWWMVMLEECQLTNVERLIKLENVIIHSRKNHHWTTKPLSKILLRIRIFTRSHSITQIDWILDLKRKATKDIWGDNKQNWIQIVC